MTVQELNFRQTVAALMSLVEQRVEVLVQHGDERFAKTGALWRPAHRRAAG
jgi:hypothetical protein